MDYEKAYKDALERAKDVHTYYCDDREQLRKIESIFPELAESEDERIRKWLIAQLELKSDANNPHDLELMIPKSIDWLEKQGDTNKTIDSDELAQGVLRGAAINLITWIDYNAAEGNPCLSNMECKDIEDALVSGDWNKIYAYMKKKLEKQGEQKKSYDVCDSSMMDNKKSPYGEKRDFGYFEEKPADKVEPKFKVGDWIVSDYNNVAYIESIGETKYNLQCKDGYHEKMSIEYIDRCWHLWSIEDAKDGDVLIDVYGNIGIVKKYIGKYGYCDKCFDTYCFVDWDGIFRVDEYMGSQNIHPATKEQRDALFAKMKEAGYEWDNEKKEVKKIVPIFNVGDTIAKKHNSDINKFGQFTITDITGGKYWYNDRIICDIAEQDDWELLEKSAKWSEEDNKMLDKIINALIGAKNVDCADYSIMYDWLNLIEQRIGV